MVHQIDIKCTKTMHITEPGRQFASRTPVFTSRIHSMVAWQQFANHLKAYHTTRILPIGIRPLAFSRQDPLYTSRLHPTIQLLTSTDAKCRIPHKQLNDPRSPHLSFFFIFCLVSIHTRCRSHLKLMMIVIAFRNYRVADHQKIVFQRYCTLSSSIGPPGWSPRSTSSTGSVAREVRTTKFVGLELVSVTNRVLGEWF